MSHRRFMKRAALAVAISIVVPASFVAQAADTQPLTAKVNLSAVQGSTTFDRFIVTYRDGATERSNPTAVVQGVTAAISRAGLNNARVGGMPPVTMTYKRKLGIGAQLVRASRKLSATEATTLMQQMAADPAVAHVEVDRMMKIVGGTTVAPQTFTPNDPSYATYQWHYSNATGGADVNNAWDVADGTGITVAVIDTGITQHSDLNMSLAGAGYDFISDGFVSGRSDDTRAAGGWDTGDWTTEDKYLTSNGGCVTASQQENSSWHGTHVSGTISELTNNGVGMAGVAYNAKVLPVRALGHCGGYNSDIADAITWASGGHVDGVPDNTTPVQVISMSLGGDGVCDANDVAGQAITGALARGVTVVVAAGNSNSDVANFTPASCPGVISVAANGITGKRAFYSNYGAGVTISAPGGGIYQNDASSGQQANPTGFVWSTVNTGTHAPLAEGYGGMAGTSQATPHVSGTVALMLSAQKQAGVTLSTPGQIKNILASTARPFPVVEDQLMGTGILDARAAVNKAISSTGSTEVSTPLTAGVTLTNQQGAGGTSQLFTLNVPAGAKNLNLRTFGGTGDVSIYVKAGVAPAADGSDADFKSARPGNTETVVIASPQTTTYYIRVAGVTTYTKLSVIGAYTL